MQLIDLFLGTVNVKIPSAPAEQEINKQVIFRGERLYEESLGDTRFYIQDLLSQFDAVLAKQNQKEIDSFRKELIKIFDEIEGRE